MIIKGARSSKTAHLDNNNNNNNDNKRCTELQDRALGDGTSPSEDVEKQRSPRKMFHPNVPHKLALDLVSIHLLKILMWARTENT